MLKSVLIVDDSLVSRMMIKEIIASKYAEWQITEAKNSDEAIKASTDKQFDLITLDLNMPGRSGLEAAPEIIALQPNAKIALMTANIQTSVKDKAEALGLEFVVKPITEDSVLGFIEE